MLLPGSGVPGGATLALMGGKAMGGNMTLTCVVTALALGLGIDE
jgi:hypothetical protein